MRPGLDEHTQTETRGFNGIGGICRIELRRHQILVAANLCGVDAFPIEHQLDFLRILQTANCIQIGTIQPNLEIVLGVDGKGMCDTNASDRAERHPFQVHVLRQVLAHRVGIAADVHRRIADCDRADLSSGSQIRLQQGR